MRKLLTTSILVIVTLFFAADFAVAQERGNNSARPSPNATVSQTVGTTVVTVGYSRPGIKGRSYFEEGADLAPAGSVWRTGANESTTITFSDNVVFGGEEIEAGTYSLYSIPNGDSWTLIINSKLSWGTQYDSAEDYARVDAAVIDNGASNMERFTIYFDTLSNNKGHLNLHWGTTKVAVPITIPEM
ncbi:MAG: DUF2911 domain-containing protein [Balneolaceae bacterium]|nr:DUF2911 domain-containing protein [Balneolaceae bacterium]